MKFKIILFYALILTFLPVSFTLYGQAEKEESVEDIYSKAIDARFDGNLAQSRFLLEKLIDDGITNEYVSELLLEVYGEYILSLMQKKDFPLLQTAYTGIRQNIAKIWDAYPESATIQNNGLMIAWITGDKVMGTAMSEIILEKNPNHPFANFLMGMNLFNPTNYEQSEYYFQKIADAPITPNMEKFIFQSRIYLGDIALERKQYQKSLKYYHKAEELLTTADLNAKLAVLETYNWNFAKAIEYFQQIPLQLMTPELFDTYMAALLGDNTHQSRILMTYLLSQNLKNPPFSQALLSMYLGRTQKALSQIEQAHFIQNEMPWAEFYLKSILYKRFEQIDDVNAMYYKLGNFAFHIGKFKLSKNYLIKVPRQNDWSGDIAYLLGKLEKKEKKYSKAIQYYQESLQAESNTNQLLIYTDLLDISMNMKDFSQAEHYLIKAAKLPNIDTHWLDLMYGYIRVGEGKYEQAEHYIDKVLIKNSNNILLNNFMATIYIEQKKYEQAEHLLDNILKQDPNNIITMNHLAYLYAITQKYLDKALELSLSTLQQQPDEIAYLDTLAWIYFQKNELDNAQEIFSQIEQQIDNDINMEGMEEIFEHLRQFYQKTGNVQKVEKYTQ